MWTYLGRVEQCVERSKGDNLGEARVGQVDPHPHLKTHTHTNINLSRLSISVQLVLHTARE
jgi:hypothetical protein